MASKAEQVCYTPVKEKHGEVLRKKPWWTEYHDRLNTYVNEILPGSHVVAHTSPDCLIEGLFKENVVIPDPEKDMVCVEGELRACHDNCEKLLAEEKIEVWMTGYAMSDDGLWRHHSWGKDKDGRIVETTLERLAYLGVRVTVAEKDEIVA